MVKYWNVLPPQELEHAVARFFQRNKNIYNEKTEDYDLFKIIPEFIYVAYLVALFHKRTSSTKTIHPYHLPPSDRQSYEGRVRNHEDFCPATKIISIDHMPL
jgi:hypothetical protein